MRALLLANVAVVAACALVYELLVATLASYVLGDTIVEFSVVLGLYLSAMGIGAWVSRALARDPARRYVEAEIALALVGGASGPLLLLAARAPGFRALAYGDAALIGALVGLELPLLMRMLGEDASFRDVVARALAFDYAGALAASVLFPLLLVPALGIARTSLLTGAINATMALSATWLRGSTRARLLRGVASAAAIALGIAFVRAGSWTALVAE